MDTLKLRFKAQPMGKAYSPAEPYVELNGVKLMSLVELRLHFKGKNHFPVATLIVNLEELDIDTETLTRLQAFVEKQEEANAS